MKKSIEHEVKRTAEKAVDLKYLAKITPVIMDELEKGDKNRLELQATVVTKLRLRDGFKALLGVKEVIKILQANGTIEKKWKDTDGSHEKMLKHRLAIMDGKKHESPIKNYGVFGLVKKAKS